MRVPDLAASTAEAGVTISHNLLGQRLGRKGRGTRERILAAAERVLADPDAGAFSLSAVAREASLGMTTLYLYFGDLAELLVAVLDPIMASAEQSYVGQIRQHWPDAELATRAETFVRAFHDFWKRHARVLHLRNSYASGLDARMVHHRIESSQPLIDLIVAQMDGDHDVSGAPVTGMASALMTGIERLVTVTTDIDLQRILAGEAAMNIDNLLRGQARLLELGIRDGRATAASA
jgi:AcrR family transcriptional regulator